MSRLEARLSFNELERTHRMLPVPDRLDAASLASEVVTSTERNAVASLPVAARNVALLKVW